MLSKKVSEKISAVLQVLVRDDNFWGWVLSGLDIEPTIEQPFAALRWKQKTKSFSLLVNEHNIMKLSDKTLQALLQHELIHRALDHIPRMKELQDNMPFPEGTPFAAKHSLTNIAADIAVHDMMDPEFVRELEEYGACTAMHFKLPEKLSLEQYAYRLLEATLKTKENDKKQKDQEPGDQEPEDQETEDQETEAKETTTDEDENEGQGSLPSDLFKDLPSELLSDLDTLYGDFDESLEEETPNIFSKLDIDEEKEFKELVQEQLRRFHDDPDVPPEDYQNAYDVMQDILEQTKEEVLKSKGSLPGGMQELIKRLPTKKLNWTKLLEKKIFTGMGGVRKRNWGRPNRRRISGLPGTKPKGSPKTILFCVDTSGSMGTKELGAALDVLYKTIEYFPNTKIMVAQGDAAITELTPAKKLNAADFKGRGGTVLKIFLDLQEQLKPDITILFSDGIDSPEDWPITLRHIIFLLTGTNTSVWRWAEQRGYQTIFIPPGVDTDVY